MTINCGNKRVKLSYVAGSAAQFSSRTGTTALSDSIVTSGASIGTYSPNGDVWGCWDERVWVTLTVRVEETPTTIDVCPNIPGDQATVPSGMTQDANGNCINTVISTGECRAVQINVEDARARRIGVNINAAVDNGATVVGYRIDWGDGTSSDKQKDSHTYAQDGTYRVSASVQVRYNDGRTEWKTANGCIRDVTFSGDKTPTVNNITPSHLPATGAAGLASIFAGVSTVATIAYSVVSRRFSKSA
jgi:PKD domain